MQLKWPFVIRFVPDQYQYKTQMCDKAVVELPGPLESVSDCYKNQTMCDKAVLLANLCS